MELSVLSGNAFSEISATTKIYIKDDIDNILSGVVENMNNDISGLTKDVSSISEDLSVATESINNKVIIKIWE